MTIIRSIIPRYLPAAKIAEMTTPINDNIAEISENVAKPLQAATNCSRSHKAIIPAIANIPIRTTSAICPFLWLTYKLLQSSYSFLKHFQFRLEVLRVCISCFSCHFFSSIFIPEKTINNLRKRSSAEKQSSRIYIYHLLALDLTRL